MNMIVSLLPLHLLGNHGKQKKKFIYLRIMMLIVLDDLHMDLTHGGRTKIIASFLFTIDLVDTFLLIAIKVSPIDLIGVACMTHPK